MDNNVLIKENKKLKFTNTILYNKNNKLKAEKLDLEESIYRLQQEITYYKNYIRNNKLKIVEEQSGK